MTLDKLVEDNYHQLNENDLYIWQYILHHKRECQRISIKDLARNCNVKYIARYIDRKSTRLNSSHP